MNYVNNVINFVSWVSSPIWQGCSRKASDKASTVATVAFAHSGGGASSGTSPSPGGATSAAVAAAQGQPLPSPGFMERMKGFFGCGSTQISSTVLSNPDTSWVGLSAGQTFWQNGVQYRICSTLGDGACAIHAVLGTLNNGQYRIAQPRNTYVDALNKAIVFSARSDQTFGGFYAVKTLEGFLSDRLAEIISGTALSNETKALQDNIVKLAPKPWFSKPFLDRLIAETAQLEIEVGQKKKSARELETLRLRYAQDPIVKDAYLRTCLHSDYYFTDQEIEVMAELFNKKVTIFGQASSKPVTYNNSGQEEVFVHFRGSPIGHYSRVEIVKS